MTVSEHEYDSDSSLPEEFKNTNHSHSFVHNDNCSDLVNESDHGSKNRRRQLKEHSQKSRQKAAQNQVYKKLKQKEEEERQKRKQAQRRGKGGQDESEEEEEEEVSREDPAIANEIKTGRAETLENDNEDERGSISPSDEDKDPRHSTQSTSSSQSESKARKQAQPYDMIDRSNKRAARRRQPEDEV
jgi:hypothetical protein